LPASPLFAIFISWLSSTPAGTKKLIFSSSFILPSPLQTLQGFLGFFPSPPHSGQTAHWVKDPKKLLFILWTRPVPLQAKHSST
jgi:hypothetical protein